MTLGKPQYLKEKNNREKQESNSIDRNREQRQIKRYKDYRDTANCQATKFPTQTNASNTDSLQDWVGNTTRMTLLQKNKDRQKHYSLPRLSTIGHRRDLLFVDTTLVSVLTTDQRDCSPWKKERRLHWLKERIQIYCRKRNYWAQHILKDTLLRTCEGDMLTFSWCWEQLIARIGHFMAFLRSRMTASLSSNSSSLQQKKTKNKNNNQGRGSTHEVKQPTKYFMKSANWD